MDDAAARAPVARGARAVAVASTVALIVVGTAWELWLAPTGSGTLAIKVLPLFVPLPGLIRARLYTYRWLSLAVWIYAAEGAVRATTERGVSASLALVELALALALFAACCVHVRARLRAARPSVATP
jgi:uncharacterized membrane protein